MTAEYLRTAFLFPFELLLPILGLLLIFSQNSGMDLNIFPYGTIFYIPDYGWGKVEDVGSAIKGYHIDLFFKSHQEALTWGRKNKNVHVWFPN